MPRGRLRHELLVTWVYLAIMAATGLPTPLYPLYSRLLGLSTVDVTAVYGCYAVTVLVTLLLAGSLSDRIGRRPVLWLAVATTAASEIMLATPPTVVGLYLSRGLTGIAVALAISSLPAYLADIAGPQHLTRASVFGVAANMGGQALGTFLAGRAAGWTLDPLVAPYVAGLVLLLPAILLWTSPASETTSRTRVTGPRYKRKVRIPAKLKADLRALSVALVAAYAMVGFLTATTAEVLQQRMHVADTSTAGLVAALLFVAGAGGQLLAGPIMSSRNPAVTVIPLPAAAVLLILAMSLGSLALFYGTVVVSGFGAGICLRSATSRTFALSPPENRAYLNSLLFTAVYLGSAVPTIAAGLLATMVDLVTAALSLSSVVVLLSITSCLLLARLPTAELTPGRRVIQR